MRAVDTNVLVRFLVRDDERQAQKARRVFRGGDVFIPKTVLLETEWVLRYTYSLRTEAVAAGLDKVSRMHGVTVEDSATVKQAIGWHRQGLDFADALHIASSRSASSFCSFDRGLQKRAGKPDTIEVKTP